jgi:hypothetical protein
MLLQHEACTCHSKFTTKHATWGPYCTLCDSSLLLPSQLMPSRDTTSCDGASIYLHCTPQHPCYRGLPAATDLNACIEGFVQKVISTYSVRNGFQCLLTSAMLGGC